MASLIPTSLFHKVKATNTNVSPLDHLLTNLFDTISSTQGDQMCEVDAQLQNNESKLFLPATHHSRHIGMALMKRSVTSTGQAERAGVARFTYAETLEENEPPEQVTTIDKVNNSRGNTAGALFSGS